MMVSSSVVMCFFRTLCLHNCGDDGVSVAMIPIPWNVPCPSRVQMLWSTLSAMNCTDLDSSYPTKSMPWWKAALLSYVEIVLYEQQNPISCRVSIRNRDSYIRWSSTPSPNNTGTKIVLGLAAWMRACPIADIFLSLELVVINGLQKMYQRYW